MLGRSTRTALQLESLEARDVPAIAIQIDYSRDYSGFFNNSEARATIERVASEIGNSLNANLSAITPSGNNTWSATFFDPTTGSQTSLSGLSIGANTLKVFVGARSMSSSEAGYGGYGGFSASGTQSWLNTVQQRGHSGFSTWGGSIAFDSGQNWYFGQSTDGLNSGKLDFYSVAVHEMGHVLGLGTAPEWKNLVQNGSFRGGSAMSVYGGAVPVSPSGNHWADGITVNGQAVSLDPSLPYGQRVAFTSLDAAALNDLGWGNSSGSTSNSNSAPPTPVVQFVVVGNANGTISQYAVINGTVIVTGAQFNPFPGYRGPFHQTFGDFDGDGHLDVAVATVGPGPGLIAVISGLDGHYIGGPKVAPGGVAGMIALDVDGNGTLELLTVEGTPMGLYVYNVTGGLILADARFSAFGSPGRAALTTSGELDRTGYGDTLSKDSEKDQGRFDDEGSRPAAYTVSAAPMSKPCTCGACSSLARMAAADEAANAPAWENELLSPIRVA